MKKILAICILVLSLNSCAVRGAPNRIENKVEEPVDYTIKTVTHDGHKFIVFNKRSWNASVYVIHHPDCQCNDKSTY